MTSRRLARETSLVIGRRAKKRLCAWMYVLLLGFGAADSRGGEIPSPPLVRGDQRVTLNVGGLPRSFVVHVPSGYISGATLPLVIMLHGGGGSARAAMVETGWREKADEAGFLAVFPNAMPPDPSRPGSFTRNPQLWNDGSDRFYPGQAAVDDVGFIAAILDDLSARRIVDERRVYVTGFSNGAGMSFLVGARLSSRIAAIAPVAGANWLRSISLERPVSLMYVTGDADPLNPIEGGVPRLLNGASDSVRAKPKPPVRESISKWILALGLPATPVSVTDANGLRTEVYGPERRGGAEIVTVTVSGLGHAWPGGRALLPEWLVGPTSDRFRATDAIWKFFTRHAMTLGDPGAGERSVPAVADPQGH